MAAGKTGAKKSASKKSAAKSKGGEFEVVLDLARETKNTLRFETDAEDAAINPLYIQKSAFDGATPDSVTVTVTFS